MTYTDTLPGSPREIVSIDDPRLPVRIPNTAHRRIAAEILSGASDQEAAERTGHSGYFAFVARNIRLRLRGVCRKGGCPGYMEHTDGYCDRHHELSRTGRSVRVKEDSITAWLDAAGREEAEVARAAAIRAQVRSARARKSVMEAPRRPATRRSPDALLSSASRMEAYRKARSGKLRF